LRQVLEESFNNGYSGSKAALDEEGRERLESLGYIAGTSVREDFEFDQSKEDPKDSQAISHYSEALRINPSFAKAHDNLKKALTLQGLTEDNSKR